MDFNNDFTSFTAVPVLFNKNSIVQVIFFCILHRQLPVQIINACIHVDVTFGSFSKLLNTANLIDPSFYEFVHTLNMTKRFIEKIN